MDGQTENILNLREGIKFRKISSLDGSDLYGSLDEKLRSLEEKKITIKERTNTEIPTYSKAKAYRNNKLKRVFSRVGYFQAIVRQRLVGKDYPVIAIIVVNNKCNWNCTYCFGDYSKRNDIDYSTNEIKYIVDELHAMGCRYINMHGGETLLRSDVGELVNFIKNKGMYLAIITNGQLLPKRLDDLRGVDSITLSLDGRSESNDKVRGNGTHDIALSAVRLAIKEGIPVRVSATVTKHTKNDVGYLAELAKKEGFQLYFSILFKSVKHATDIEMDAEEIQTALKQIARYKHMGYPIFTTHRALRAALEWPFDYNAVHHCTEAQIPSAYRKYHIPCYYSKTKFTIEADGYIYPCFLTTDGSFQPKNWREVGLREAIKHVMVSNTCKACPAMSQNDHNLLLGLNFKHVAYVIKEQWKEALNFG